MLIALYVLVFPTFPVHLTIMQPIKKARFSALSFFSGPPRIDKVTNDSPRDLDIPLTDGPTHLRRNKTERTRLQGLVHVMSEGVSKEQGSADGGNEGVSGVRRMVEKTEVWMVNEGESCICVEDWCWAIIKLRKEESTNPRSQVEITSLCYSGSFSTLSLFLSLQCITA